MRLPAPKDGGDFTPPPAGTFPAICYRVIDLGTQSAVFKGKTKRLHKIMLSWEIHDEEAVTEDGKPMSIHQRYTWSMHTKATLRRDLEAWRGRKFTDKDFGDDGFDIKNLLGKPCLLSIVHNDKDGNTYANINSVSKLPKGMAIGKQVNANVYLWLEPGHFDREAFASLSDSMQDVIKSAPEYVYLSKNGANQETMLDAEDGDESDNSDCPF